MSAEVLCRVDAHGLGIQDVVPPLMLERMRNWQAGLRSFLGPRHGEQRQIAGPRAPLRLRDVSHSASSTAANPPARQDWLWWQEGQATAWPRSDPTEEETIDWGDGGE